MPLSLRLGQELETRIESYCKQTGLSKTRVITESLSNYLDTHAAPSLYDLAKDLIEPAPAPGTRKLAGAQGDKSETRRRRYRDYVKAKHGRRTGTRG